MLEKVIIHWIIQLDAMYVPVFILVMQPNVQDLSVSNKLSTEYVYFNSMYSLIHKIIHAGFVSICKNLWMCKD